MPSDRPAASTPIGTRLALTSALSLPVGVCVIASLGGAGHDGALVLIASLVLAAFCAATIARIWAPGGVGRGIARVGFAMIGTLFLALAFATAVAPNTPLGSVFADRLRAWSCFVALGLPSLVYACVGSLFDPVRALSALLRGITSPPR